MVNKPELIRIAFGDKGLKNTIPDQNDPQQPGKASMEEGFPAANMLPLDQGGIPPSGRDMNGILNLLAQHIQYVNAGGIAEYDADFASQSGGYPLYALLKANQQGFAFWLNSVAGNATDPNGPQAAGWTPLVPLSQDQNNLLSYKQDGLFFAAPNGGWDSIVKVDPAANNVLSKNSSGELHVLLSQDSSNIIKNTAGGVEAVYPDAQWLLDNVPISKTNGGILSKYADGFGANTQAPPNLSDQYVSTSLGDDSRTISTPEKPLKTIREAVKRLQNTMTGATINLHVGETYYTAAGGQSVVGTDNSWIDMGTRGVVFQPYCLNEADDPVFWGLTQAQAYPDAGLDIYAGAAMKRPVISTPVYSPGAGLLVACGFYTYQTSALTFRGCIIEYTKDLNAWQDGTSWGSNTSSIMNMSMFSGAGNLTFADCQFRNLRPDGNQALIGGISTYSGSLNIQCEFLDSQGVFLNCWDAGNTFSLTAIDRDASTTGGWTDAAKTHKIEFPTMPYNAKTFLSNGNNYTNLAIAWLKTSSGNNYAIYTNLTANVQIN